MFRILWLITLAFIVIGLADASAGSPVSKQQPLWPDGAPGAGGESEGDVPQLFLTLVESDRPTAAIVILPGGGYGGHAMDHEGQQFAEWFASLGISSAICNYRLRGKGNDGKGYGHPYPMIDAQRAIQTLAKGRRMEHRSIASWCDWFFGRRTPLLDSVNSLCPN